MKVHRPESLGEALEILDLHGDDAKLYAGGTAFTIFHKLGLIHPEHLVLLDRLEGIAGITFGPEIISVGAMARIGALERHEQLNRVLPLLPRTLRHVANLRVRNVATIGGNICEGDPTTDPPALMIALRARARIASSQGERLLDMRELFAGNYATNIAPTEILTHIEIPRSDVKGAYVKFLSRHGEDRACLGAAVALAHYGDGELSEISVALMGAASTPVAVRVPIDPRRAQSIRDAEAEIIELIMQDAEPPSDSRGTRDYKMKLIPRIVTKALVLAHDGADQAVCW